MDNFNLKSVFPPTMIENETVINKVFMQMFVDAILKNKDGLTQSNKDIGLISEILANVKEGFESHIANHPSGGTEYVHPETHPASMITGLSNVATSGNYSDLKGLPTIPTVDVTKSYVDTELSKKANASHNHTDKIDKNVYDAKVKELSDKINALEELINNHINPPKPPAKIYYGRLSLAEVGGSMTQYANITANMIKNSSNLTVTDPKTFGKTTLGREADTSMGDHIVILVPQERGYTATKDNGFGGKVAFDEDIAGANGITLEMDGNTYKLYGEMLNTPSEIFFYID